MMVETEGGLQVYLFVILIKEYTGQIIKSSVHHTVCVKY